uniref:Uncharacterized protein n=1 Tax=Onchocerca volvulus TaxID=6282 RepID=A0A8R1TK41_ONCVO
MNKLVIQVKQSKYRQAFCVTERITDQLHETLKVARESQDPEIWFISHIFFDFLFCNASRHVTHRGIADLLNRDND